MKKASVAPISLSKFNNGIFSQEEDLLAIEEPMEIRLIHGPSTHRETLAVSVTMRTPGNDFELAVGFLFTEGIIQSFDEIIHVRYCHSDAENSKAFNVVKVEISEEVQINKSKLQRNFYTTSSCGVCGKASIDSVKQHCDRLELLSFRVEPNVLLSLSEKLASVQTVFKHTGGIHASALFDSKGNLLFHREDVGRHNALDKLIGYLVSQKEINPNETILLLSGRASFELVQKAAMAKIPVIAAVGAPSSLAVSTASEFGISLYGFLREGKYNQYT
jgi:FdhD protein